MNLSRNRGGAEPKSVPKTTVSEPKLELNFEQGPMSEAEQWVELATFLNAYDVEIWYRWCSGYWNDQTRVVVGQALICLVLSCLYCLKDWVADSVGVHRFIWQCFVNVTELFANSHSGSQSGTVENKLQTYRIGYEFTELTILDLSDNGFKVFPDTIWDLSTLSILDLSNNKLTALSENVGNLIYLVGLDVSSNQLEHLPATYPTQSFSESECEWQ